MTRRLLALETSGLGGSVAALEDGVLRGQQMLPTSGTARWLMPAVQQLLASLGWQPGDLAVVALAAGPGSFTGVRIGVTTAKMLVYALGCDLVAVDTLEVLAQQAPAQAQHVAPILDAQRGELFAAEFQRQDDQLVRVGPTRLVGADAWLRGLAPGTLVIGRPLRRLADRLPPQAQVADESLWEPQAATVGRIAWQRYQAGQRDDPWTLVPRYLRRAAAEEKLAAEGKLHADGPPPGAGAC